MFERLTESARRLLFFARYEASQLGSETIEPVHLLLGMLREADGLTRDLLVGAANPLDELRREIEGHVVTGPKVATTFEIPFSEGTKRALQLASHEADGLSRSHIGTEHLLLGILANGDSVAAAILRGRELNLDSARARVNRPA